MNKTTRLLMLCILCLALLVPACALAYGDTHTLWIGDPSPTVEPTATPAPTPSPTPVKQPPKLTMSKATLPATVTAGTSFNLSVSLKNIGEQSAHNIIVTVRGESTDIRPSNNTGEYTMGNIAAGKTGSITAKLSVQATAESKPYKITVNYSYTDDTGEAHSESGEVIVQVTHKMRIEYDKPNIPENINAGDTMTINMNIMNLGKSMAFNTRINVEGNGLMPESTLFLGNIEAGSNKSGDIYVFVGSLNSESDASTDRYGQTTGKVIITFEDEFGQTYTEEYEFYTYIEAPYIPPVPEPTPDPTQQTAGQWWITILVIALILTAIIAVLLVRKARIKKQQEMDDDEDY